MLRIYEDSLIRKGSMHLLRDWKLNFDVGEHFPVDAGQTLIKYQHCDIFCEMYFDTTRKDTMWRW